MSIFEYDKEEEERKLRKAEFEAGYNSGRQDGIKVGMETGIRSGIKSMLELGKYSPEEIAEVFHVSVDEVEQINDK